MGRESKTLWKSLRRFIKPEPSKVTRARRIPIESPLSFRPLRQPYWSHGTIFNISSSGVLFRADKNVDTQNLVQMEFVLPNEIAGKDSAKVLCWGQVVRTVIPPVSDGQPHFGARILDYLPGTQWNPDVWQIEGDDRDLFAKK